MQLIIYLIFALACIYLIMVFPGEQRKTRMGEFAEYYIAHRGLFDNKGQAPENSLAAIKLAVKKGYGVEIDVRETDDEELVLLHDDNIHRVTGGEGRASQMTLRELRQYRLFKSMQTIPTLEQALKVVNGRVPLVIEIKSEDSRRTNVLCEHLCFYLDSYEGTACIESFNPKVLYWFKKNRPMTLRGQLSEKFRKLEFPHSLAAPFVSRCVTNFLTKPDFIAYNWKHAHLLRFQLLRKTFRSCTAAWTVRSEAELKEARKNFDIFIFDSFEPSIKINRPWVKETMQGGEVNMSDFVREHVYVSGEVQAVGFRFHATQIAQDLGVTGWVRNLDDGRVEMELQGTKDQLNRMMEELAARPYIRIYDVEKVQMALEKHEMEFKVKY